MDASKNEPIKTDTMFDKTDIAELSGMLKRKPWILFDESNYSPKEFESGQRDMVIDLLLLLFKMHRCFDILCCFIVVKLKEIWYSVTYVDYEYLVCITISIR